MSRRRGEFEHRTSIFEGAFRAWSHLGGLEPIDLETKPAADLDPLAYPLENDPRLAAQKEKEKDKKASKDDGNDGSGSGDGKKTPADEFNANLTGEDANGGKRREYPYEPLPRSGLAHPFVQAILSPWLGPDADQDAIQLGLTTLRTWWQHRRKGESGSAIVALGTEKMRGVVEGYTRHFFNLAHCLIVNDKEQPPRTLQGKMRDLEKSRNKKSKKRSREDDSVKIAAMAFKSGFGGGMPPIQNTTDLGGGCGGGGGMNQHGGMGGMGGGGGPQGNPNMPQDDMLSSLERLHAAQRRQLAESGGVHSSMNGMGGMQDNHGGGMGNFPQMEMKGRCMPGKVDLPGLVQQVSSAATQLAHRGMINPDPAGIYGSAMGQQQSSALDPSKYGDPNIMPVVLVSQNGDVQFFMRIDGITCAHCVKIVETVLKGCQGNRSPINGLLDAAADRELNLVLIKIENVADARRIAFDATRNLSMVGYTAKARSVNVQEISKGNDVGLQGICSAFEQVPNINPMSVFNWHMDCACPDNGVHRQDCARHAQMGRGIIDIFDKTERLVTEIIAGCGKKFGMPCTAGMNCFCRNSNEQQKVHEQQQQQHHQQQQQQMQHQQQQMQHQQQQYNNMNNQMNQYSAGMSYQQPIQDNSQGGGNDYNNAQQQMGGRMPRASMRMSLGGLGRHFSMASETTFGRAMSGLSALSIDWENMEDFDINVDHSAHINNDIINNQQQQQGQQQQQQHQHQHQQNQQQQHQHMQQNLKDDGNNGNMNGMMDNGGNDLNGYGMQNGMGYNMGRMERRSSLRKNIPMDPNGIMNNVSFNI